MVTITLITLTTTNIVALFRKLHASFPGRRFELETTGGIRMIDYTQAEDRLFMFNLPTWPVIPADALFDWDINRVHRMLCAGQLIMKVTLVGKWASWEINRFEIAFQTIGSISNFAPFLKIICRQPIGKIELCKDVRGSYFKVNKRFRLSINVLHPTPLLPTQIIRYARAMLSIIYMRDLLRIQLSCRFKSQFSNDIIDCKTHQIVVVLAVQEVEPLLPPCTRPQYIILLNHRKIRIDNLQIVYKKIFTLLGVPPDGQQTIRFFFKD